MCARRESVLSARQVTVPPPPPTHSPLLAQMRKSLNEVLRDVVTLEVALSRKTEAHVLVRPSLALPVFRRTVIDCPSAFQALLLPQYWSSFIRSGSLEDVRPLGLGAKP